MGFSRPGLVRRMEDASHATAQQTVTHRRCGVTKGTSPISIAMLAPVSPNALVGLYVEHPALQHNLGVCAGDDDDKLLHLAPNEPR